MNSVYPHSWIRVHRKEILLTQFDPVSKPQHYNSHPSGIEVIEVTRHCQFNIGNAIKYILRHDHKGSAVQDLKKALWYLEDFDVVFGHEVKYNGFKAIEQEGVNYLDDILESEIISVTLPPPLIRVLYRLSRHDYYTAKLMLADYVSTIS